MDINIIKECSTRSLAGEITFADVVMKLIAADVERYTVDLVNFKKFYYGVDNDTYTLAFTLGVAVAKDFNANAIKEAIIAIQKGLINYQSFLLRIMSAGCCHYEAFLTGKKVIYFGRDGSHHIELFPQQ